MGLELIAAFNVEWQLQTALIRQLLADIITLFESKAIIHEIAGIEHSIFGMRHCIQCDLFSPKFGSILSLGISIAFTGMQRFYIGIDAV